MVRDWTVPDSAPTGSEFNIIATQPHIGGVGTATPSDGYTQEEILRAFDIADRRMQSVFLSGGIERRYLNLPRRGVNGLHEESQKELLEKHEALGCEIGAYAIKRCLARTGASLADVEHLCCVSSTGFLIPGLTALLIKRLGIRTTCSRVDVVGMGCNAGLNALGTVAAWSSVHQGQLAVMVCIEVCSAMYINESTIKTSVVNSLFGDGAAAISLIAGAKKQVTGPRIVRFASCMIPEAIDAMRVDWREDYGKFSFSLDATVPYVVGSHAEEVVDRLVHAGGLQRCDIRHWLIHSGGKKVIDATRVNLGLTRFDVRHTLSVLRDYGNVSSGSFLFSYERLAEEGSPKPDDYGVMMTMGPGSSIETALLKW